MSRAAIAEVLGRLEAGDFYKAAHGHIYAAITAMAERGAFDVDDSRPDTVLVADELRGEGLLEAVGGVGALVALQAGTPATSNALRYANIVRRTAVVRRLMADADAIIEAGYRMQDPADSADVDKVVTVLTERIARDATGDGEAMFEDLAPVLRHEEPAVRPSLLHRSDGMAFIYPGLLHWVYGEPEAGKTMFALLAALATIRRGLSSGYLDYEGSRAIVGERLEQFGATELDVASFRYRRPSVESGRLGMEMARVIDGEGIALVVIDGCAKALARESLDEDKAAPVLGWIERLCAPMQAAGAAVIVLDHVVKDRDGQGRWPRGSGAKLGEVDGAAYHLIARKPFSRSTPGYSAVLVGKDREGIVGSTGETVGIMHVDSSTEHLVWIDPAPDNTPPSDSTSNARDAVLSVVGELVDGIEINQRQLEERVRRYGRFRHDAVRAAAESLALEGLVSVRTGARKARLWGPGRAPDPVLEEEF